MMGTPIAPFPGDPVEGARIVRQYFPTPSVENVSCSGGTNWRKQFFWASMVITGVALAWYIIPRFRDLYQTAKTEPSFSGGEEKRASLADQYKLY